MNITEIRVKLVTGDKERLRAFCSMTIDNTFVVRDLKVIDGMNGPFVAMPSRKLMDHCPKCGGKNHLRARFCNDCGTKLKEDRVPRDGEGRAALHADIAHPMNRTGREFVQAQVIAAYEKEMQAAREPGYEPKELAAHEEDDGSNFDDFLAELRSAGAQRRGRPAETTSSEPPPQPPGSDEPVSRLETIPSPPSRPRPVADTRPTRHAEAVDDSFSAGL